LNPRILEPFLPTIWEKSRTYKIKSVPTIFPGPGLPPPDPGIVAEHLVNRVQGLEYPHRDQYDDQGGDPPFGSGGLVSLREIILPTLPSTP